MHELSFHNELFYDIIMPLMYINVLYMATFRVRRSVGSVWISQASVMCMHAAMFVYFLLFFCDAISLSASLCTS